MKRRSQLLGSFANLRLKKVATRSARRSSRFRGLLRIHNVGRTRSQKLEEHLSYRSLVKSQSRSLKTSQDKKKSSDTQKDSSKPVFSNGQRKINLEQETLMEVPSLSPPVIQKCFKCRRLLKGEFVTCATKLNKQGLRCNNTAHVACISLESSSCLERDLKNWRCSECYSHCTFCKELLLIEDQGVVKCEGCWLYFHLNCVSAYIKLLDETSPYDSSKFSVKHDSWYCYLCTVFNGQIIESILTHKPSEPEILNKTRSSSAPICDPTLSENFSEFEKNENIDISLVLYVKFSQMSHFHDGWVPDYWVEACNVSLFRRYKRRIETINGPSVRSVVHQDWKTMQRVIAEKKEPAPFGPSKKVRKLYYVKWTNMEYAESTWEYLSSGGRAGSFYNAYLKDSEVDFAGVARLEEQLVVLYKAFLSHMAVQDTPACRTPKFKEINEQPAFLAGGQLHSYQLDGLNWLLYNMTHRINCILADEMGLGKTLQAVSYICCRYQLEDFGVGLSFRQNPCLVVAPLSTCHNWLAEFSKWAPQLNVVFYSGDAASREIIENHELFLPFSRGLPRIHVLVTTYENCLSNPPFLRRIKWMAIIVDEGQRLKNNESKLFYTLSQIDDAHRILLTGTPLQNDIYELHNLLLFLDPAKFDSDNYREKFSSENWTDIKNIEDLHRRIRPHLLRRVKSDVLSDLPPKKEVIVPTLQTSLQRHLSREIIKGDLKILQKGKRTSNVLRNTLIQLRKCINHPYLFPNIEPEDDSSSDTVYERLVNASGKTIILDSLIPRLLKEGHRVLLFCTFKIMLDILEDYFDYRGWKYLRFDGTTSQRDRTWMIDQFNQPGSEESIFMMTIRAGGLGINLQTADTVILYDSDFNPQMDIQAISRCHRIGQKRPVMVYRFVTVKSIEEGIWARAKRKRLLEKIFIDKVDEKIETADIEQLLSVASKLLFEDPDLNDSQSKVVKYDDQFIERLLDRTITAGEEEEMLGSTNSLFSFNTARVWDDESITEEAKEFWDELIQKEVSKTVCEDVLLGRGARRKNTVDYSNFEDDAPGPSKKSKSIMRDEKEYRPTSATETEESEEEVSAAVPTLSLANSKKVEAYMQDMAKPPYLVKNEPSISAPGQPLPSPAKLLPRPPINKEGVAKIPLPRAPKPVLPSVSPGLLSGVTIKSPVFKFAIPPDIRISRAEPLSAQKAKYRKFIQWLPPALCAFINSLKWPCYIDCRDILVGVEALRQILGQISYRVVYLKKNLDEVNTEKKQKNEELALLDQSLIAKNKEVEEAQNNFRLYESYMSENDAKLKLNEINLMNIDSRELDLKIQNFKNELAKLNNKLRILHDIQLDELKLQTMVQSCRARVHRICQALPISPLKLAPFLSELLSDLPQDYRRVPWIYAYYPPPPPTSLPERPLELKSQSTE